MWKKRSEEKKSGTQNKAQQERKRLTEFDNIQTSRFELAIEMASDKMCVRVHYTTSQPAYVHTDRLAETHTHTLRSWISKQCTILFVVSTYINFRFDFVNTQMVYGAMQAPVCNYTATDICSFHLNDSVHFISHSIERFQSESSAQSE